jgi:hypothetical protein
MAALPAKLPSPPSGSSVSSVAQLKTITPSSAYFALRIVPRFLFGLSSYRLAGAAKAANT